MHLQKRGPAKMRQTFTKADRLTNSIQFKTLSQHGKRHYNSLFIIIWQKSHASRSRLGVTVSKKVGKAVTRNRIKRIIRDFFRLNRNDLRESLDINIIARHACAKADNQTMRIVLQDSIRIISDNRQEWDGSQTGNDIDQTLPDHHFTSDGA